MRILFVADGRSPITRQWLQYWLEQGDEVYLVSTFPCAPEAALAGYEFLPLAFSRYQAGRGAASRRGLTTGGRARIRQWLGPLTLPRAARRLRAVIAQVQPDFVHALRIPYEGMVAAWANAPVPLVISVWGNDFTLHARTTPLLAYLTRLTLRRATALHADCQRDVRLARRLGLAPDCPTLVVPGNGGVRREVFFPPATPPVQPVVINPRGLRGYVRTDAFFRAASLVLEKRPEARFYGVAMAGEEEARRWVEQLKIEHAVTLLPPQPHAAMGELFRAAMVAVSPSTHDGTPNTLLEAMACGCLPVAGDIESVREWITPGKNGLLVDPCSPTELATAMLQALSDETLRQRAAQENARLIAERADYRRCMAMARAFYQQMLTHRPTAQEKERAA